MAEYRPAATGPFRFGVFEVCPSARELRKHGVRVKLQDQPFAVLLILLEKPGQLVTKEELQQRLWSADTFVEFDKGIYNAMKRLRETLSDEAETPRYIETLPRRGYRFIAPVQRCNGVGKEPEPLPVPEPAPRLRRTKRLALLALFLCVLIFAGIFFRLKLRSPLPIPKVVDSVQITKNGLNKSSVLVTDGTRVYFTEETPPGVFALAQVSANGGETSQLPIRLEWPTIYDISPSHSELLVSSGFGTGQLPEIELWIVPIPAGSPRRIGEILAHDACWMSDGRHVTYANGHDLYSAQIDGSQIRKLVTLPAIPFRPRSSPDGSRVRFTVSDLQDPNSVPSIWEINSDGSNLHRVLADGSGGSWSSDGKYYYFHGISKVDDGSFKETGVWVIPERGSLLHRKNGVPSRLTTEMLSLGDPAPGPDGKRLFVLGRQERVELVRYDKRAKELVPFLRGISAADVDVSRDGEWVTYTDYPEGNLWRSRVDGSERLQLTSPPFYVEEPRWSPDGKQIVFSWYQSKIFVVSATGGTPQQLMPDDKPDVAGAATWAPDGNSIIFGRWVGAEKGIYRLDLRTNQFSKLRGSDGLYSARLSPDGHYVSALNDKRHLMLYDFSNAAWMEIAGGNFFNNNWSHDSKYVYVEDVRESQRQMTLVRVSPVNGNLERVMNLRDIWSPGWPLSLDEDNSPILVRDKGSTEIYSLTLEN